MGVKIRKRPDVEELTEQRVKADVIVHLRGNTDGETV